MIPRIRTMRETCISITSDFSGSTGDPAPSLKAAAEAGFTHVMWCHHWNDDFLYGREELAHLKALFRDLGLSLADIHGSQGVEKCWHSPEEYCRKAGVELVANRIEMLGELGGDGTIMMHVPNFNTVDTDETRAETRRLFDAVCRSLDELMPRLDAANCAIAVENLFYDTWELIDELLSRYPSNRLGICYDSGHANANENKRIESLARHKDRLLALHLNDNDGTCDQHQPPYYGSVDWGRLSQIIATSSYTRPLNFEIVIRNTPFSVEGLSPLQQPYEARLAFAKDAYVRCARFVEECASGSCAGSASAARRKEQ